MTDDQRKTVQAAATDCIVAIAYLRGPYDREEAAALMRQVQTQLAAALEMPDA